MPSVRARLLPCGQLPVNRAFLCADGAGTSRRGKPRSDECGAPDAAARGTSRFAAPATGVQIKPAVAAYGIRAGMSFMLKNVAAKPMIVQVLMSELPERKRSFFPCQSRGLRRAQTTHAGTRSHTPLHSCPPALTHADARSRSHAHIRTDTHISKHTYAHTHTHTHTHTHARTRSRTLACARAQPHVPHALRDSQSASP